MRKIIILSLICFFLTPKLTLPAETIHVGPTRTHTTIQAGIDAATDADTVIVDPGTYTGPGNRDIQLTGKSITVRSDTGPQNCIIDCQGTETQPHRGFNFSNNQDANAVISGFTVTNACAEGGAGIDCRNNQDAELEIANCMIYDNTSFGGRGGNGGGISITDGIYLINNCIISNNSTERDGGGICCFESDVEITNCTITANKAETYDTHGGDGYGGGICFRESTAAITNSIINDNSAGRYGGGIYCRDSTLIITNSTFASNGNALAYYSYRSNINVTNCILWDNAPDQIYAGGGTTAITYSNIRGGWPGQGNIDNDPGFAFDGDYHLMPHSPCRDAGDPNYTPGPDEKDLDGNPRIIGSRIDMGAYEHNPTRPSIAVSERSFTFLNDWPLPAPQNLLIRNCGGGSLNWHIIEDCNWLDVSQTTGASTGQENEVTLTADPETLALGSHNCTLTVLDLNAVNSPVTVHVQFHVGEVLRVPQQFGTIQAAIDIAEDYDVVLVANGNYTGDGNRDLQLNGKSITVLSENGPENCIIDCNGTQIEPHRGFNFSNNLVVNSIIDGFTITNGRVLDNGAGINCRNNQKSTLTISNCNICNNNSSRYGGSISSGDTCLLIDNCIISDNKARSGGAINCDGGILTITDSVLTGNSTDYDGGGIYHSQRSTEYALTIENSTIAGNSADGDGGGIYSGYGYPGKTVKITDCNITGNSAGFDAAGGGIFCQTATITITNTNVAGNSAGGDGHGIGGGIYCRYGTTTITNSTIKNNKAEGFFGTYGGGGIYCSNDKLTIKNSAVADNSSGSFGGGIVCCYQSVVAIKNSIVTGNSADDGTAIYCNDSDAAITNCTFAGNHSKYVWGEDNFTSYFDSSNIQISNCIFWNSGNEISSLNNSTITAAFCNIKGGWPGDGNIDSKPDFAFDSDYHLMPDSPCINAADPNYVPEPNETDLDGNQRIIDDRVDMGAYEFNPAHPSFAFSQRSFLFLNNWPKPEPRELMIRNCGGGTLNWQIIEDCNWLEAVPAAGTSKGGINEVTISVDPNALALGSYTGNLTVLDSNALNSPVTIHVHFNIGRTLNVPAQFDTIQQAINEAEDYDMVLVADGIYTGDGNRDMLLIGKSITVCSENGPQNTIIDCNGSKADPHYGFYFVNNENINAIFDGFTITNGYVLDYGAGIACYQNFRSTLTISNCNIAGNTAFSFIGYPLNYSSGSGGGLWAASGGSYFINNCRFTKNYAARGGAISSTITSGGWVGPYYKYPATLNINNCAFTNNTAETSGGAISCTRITAAIKNCSVTGNKAVHEGGAIDCYKSTTAITNCTFAGNSSTNGNALASGVYESQGNLQVSNCILFNGGDEIATNYESTITVSFSDIQGDWPGQGNIDIDPSFVNPGFWDTNDTPADANDDLWIDGDYYLLPASPCIDTGDPCYISGPSETDLDGNPRIINGRIDMGAYEALLPPLEVPMKLTPHALNPRSKGRWLKAHFVFPEGFTTDDVDANTPALIEPLGIKSNYIDVFMNEDGFVEVVVAFSRADICGAVMGNDPVEVTVIALLTTGRQFYGTDTIRIINSKFEQLAVLSNH